MNLNHKNTNGDLGSLSTQLDDLATIDASLVSIDAKASDIATISSTLTSQATDISGIVGFQNSNIKTGKVMNGNFLSTTIITGRTDQVFTTPTQFTVCMDPGEFLHLPVSAVQISVSSDNAADIDGVSGAHKVVVIGRLADYSLSLETLSLNGLTPVTTGQSFLRLLTVQVSEATDGHALNTGNIYAYDSAVVPVLGDPGFDNSIAIIEAGQGVALTGAASFAPGEDMYLSELVISSLSDSGNPPAVEVIFLARTGGSTVADTYTWRQVARMNVDGASPIINLQQSGFPSGRLFPGVTLGNGMTDIVLQIRRLGGNTNDVNADVYLSGLAVL